jgi:hypothetical protein
MRPALSVRQKKGAVIRKLQPNLIEIKPLSEHRLYLHYETGEKKIFDVSPYIEGWYDELLDVAYFNSVRLLEDGYGIEWPNGQDIAPHELYELSILAN